MGIWPNFYIVGAAKCGTNSLYENLKRHPQVFFPKVKEPHYFVTRPSRFRNVKDEKRDIRCCGNAERYHKLYDEAAGVPAIGDASVSYLWDETAPQRIHQACPSAKIIIILRDPVIRAHSHYLNSRREHVEPESSFLKALRLELQQQEIDWFTSRLYISAGLYYEQIKRFLHVFGSEQVLILSFEDLQREPQELFSRTSRHLGIDPDLLEQANLERAYNIYSIPRFGLVRFARRAGLRGAVLPVSVQRRLRPLLFETKKPQIDNESRQVLQKIFDPDIAHLEALLGRTIPDLRKSWT